MVDVPSLFFIIMIPQLIAKHVFGMEDFLYINDPQANALVADVTSPSGAAFETSTKHRIVEFYSPYCVSIFFIRIFAIYGTSSLNMCYIGLLGQGHCINFKKTYVRVATEAKQQYGSEVLFYAVSCVGVADLCTRYSIQSYPTVFAIPAGADVKDRLEIPTKSFSVKAIENALHLTEKVPAETKRRIGENRNDEEEEDGEENEHPADDGTRNDDRDVTREGEVNQDDEVAEARKKNDDDGDEEKRGVDDHRNKLDSELEFESWKGHAEAVPMKSKVGAEQAKDLPKTMDQWKDIIKQRLREREYSWLRQKKAKAGSLGEDFVAEISGPSKVMLANRNGTVEYNQRQKDLLKVINRMKSYFSRRKAEKQKELTQRVQNGQLPYKKQITKVRLVEHLPIVKRVIRMSNEEQLILDASLSFLEGLRAGVHKSDSPLSSKQKHALKNWLDLLSVSLPPEWALHGAIGDLLENIDDISNSRKQLVHVLDKHKLPRHQWSQSCSKNIGFLCGFWKLLHTSTVGIAAYRGGQDLITLNYDMTGARIFSPLEAANTIREYMAHFFTCTECSTHFIGQYDQCDMNRRCDRLTQDVSSTTDSDWKELAKWLWEFHNDVNVRLLNKKHDEKRKNRQKSILFRDPAGPGIATLMDQADVLWPTLRECILCVRDDGTFDEEAVYLYLEQTYWYVIPSSPVR
jgi:Erv1 / Alr family